MDRGPNGFLKQLRKEGHNPRQKGGTKKLDDLSARRNKMGKVSRRRTFQEKELDSERNLKLGRGGRWGHDDTKTKGMIGRRSSR